MFCIHSSILPYFWVDYFSLIAFPFPLFGVDWFVWVAALVAETDVVPAALVVEIVVAAALVVEPAVAAA